MRTGRPFIDKAGTRRINVPVFMPAGSRAWLSTFGNGNASRGLRRAWLLAAYVEANMEAFIKLLKYSVVFEMLGLYGSRVTGPVPEKVSFSMAREMSDQIRYFGGSANGRSEAVRWMTRGARFIVSHLSELSQVPDEIVSGLLALLEEEVR